MSRRLHFFPNISISQGNNISDRKNDPFFGAGGHSVSGLALCDGRHFQTLLARYVMGRIRKEAARSIFLIARRKV